jgi:hypothetical protein
MQRRKIAVACLSLLLVGLAISTTTINRAHAFTSGKNSVTISNILANFVLPPPSGSTINVAQAGTTLPVNVVVQASLFNTPAYTRNVTIGFKGDWMVSYQNASILPLTAGQIGSTTLSIVLPSAGSLSAPHTWSVEIWDGPATGTVSGCTPGDAENNPAPNPGPPKSCFILSSGELTILTGDQYSAAQARSAALAAVSGIGIGFGFSLNQAAQGQLLQANAERNLGDQSWASGDFAGAKTHYQNSQNDANAALATQVNLGGSTTNAGIVSTILAGTGTALFGIGGLLAGIGGFFYLRRKPKA